jgi:hypothetical protein
LRSYLTDTEVRAENRVTVDKRNREGVYS